MSGDECLGALASRSPWRRPGKGYGAGPAMSREGPRPAFGLGRWVTSMRLEQSRPPQGDSGSRKV